MKNILNFLDKWGMRISTLLILIVFLKTCSTNSRIDKVQDNLEETNTKVDTLAIELRKEINQKQGKHNEDLSYIRNYLKGYYDKEGYHDPYDALNESDENSEIVANSYPEEIREKYKELRDNYTSLKKNISVFI